MKIIGHTTDGYLCQVSNVEMKSLLGRDDGRKRDNSRIGIGNDITFTNALVNMEILKEISMSSSYGTLTQAKDALAKLEGIVVILEAINFNIINIQGQVKNKTI